MSAVFKCSLGTPGGGSTIKNLITKFARLSDRCGHNITHYTETLETNCILLFHFTLKYVNM